jgi:hypothetical protein
LVEDGDLDLDMGAGHLSDVSLTESVLEDQTLQVNEVMELLSHELRWLIVYDQAGAVVGAKHLIARKSGSADGASLHLCNLAIQNKTYQHSSRAFSPSPDKPITTTAKAWT